MAIREQLDAVTTRRSKWLVTYCHVMSLMVLFAVGLTAATSQSDGFHGIRAAFGGTRGVADRLDHASQPVRYRPRSARQTLSVRHPVQLNERPAAECVAKGLGDLEELSDLVRSERCRIALPKEQFIENGAITDRGRALLRIISAQLQRFNGHALLIAPNTRDAGALIPVCLQIASETNAYAACFGVSSGDADDSEQRLFITIVVTRDIH